jgi:hypothetical protein
LSGSNTAATIFAVNVGLRDPEPPAQAELAALVPGERIHRRSRPYVGDSVNVPLRALGPEDGAVVQALYDFLGGLYGLIGPRLGGGSVRSVKQWRRKACRSRRPACSSSAY